MKMSLTESPLHEIYVDRSQRNQVLKRAEFLLSQRLVDGYYSEIELSSSEDERNEDRGWLSDRSEKLWDEHNKKLSILKKSLLRHQRITPQNSLKQLSNEKWTEVSIDYYIIFNRSAEAPIKFCILIITMKVIFKTIIIVHVIRHQLGKVFCATIE